MGLIDAFSRRLYQLVSVLTDVANGLLIAMAILVNVEVVGRYLFGFSTLIADEYASYLLVWITLLGATYSLREEKYLRVVMLVERLPTGTQKALGLISALVGLAVSVVATFGSATLVITTYRFKTVSIQPSATPLVWIELILPLGFVLLCLAYLDEIVRRLTGREGVTDHPTTAGIDL